KDFRNDVEVTGQEGRPLQNGAGGVVEESDIVVALLRIVRGRARPGLHIVEAIHVVAGRAARHGLVSPVRVVVNLELFPIQAAAPAQAPVIRRADAQLLAQVGVLLGLLPGGRRGVTLGGGAAEAGALVVVTVYTAGIVGVVLLLLDVADQVAAVINDLQRSD